MWMNLGILLLIIGFCLVRWGISTKSLMKILLQACSTHHCKHTTCSKLKGTEQSFDAIAECRPLELIGCKLRDIGCCYLYCADLQNSGILFWVSIFSIFFSLFYDLLCGFWIF
ncbi:hypothetical protein L1049_002625 [Liquidambar formosana]|uniref:Uncharacterized protein n=1 Tax=Liquidambar formosana TaxID=63359 RepID=A0AAP0NKG7_LIQFO